MPLQQLPEQQQPPLDIGSPSSLSSTSSDVILINANYIRNSRSASLSSSSIMNDDSIESSLNNLNVNNNRNKGNTENDNEDDENYRPIKLPSEPTLEELLRQVTGRSDVSTIEQVKLRIISSTISLQRLPYFMPRLRCLSLEGSLIFSLRDLGCELTSLVYLNISRCGLKSLDGTNGLTTLNELIADHNLIEDAGPCSNLVHIRKISLVSNKIKDFRGMMFLSLCTSLRVLDLSNNTITQKENYRETIKTLYIPQLAILDQSPYEDVSEETQIELTRSEYQQPSSTNIIRQLNSIQNVIRPSTASRLPVTHITIGQRPSTADKIKQPKFHNLSVGEPVCGNIITKARRPKKIKTAWGDTSSSSSFSSDSSSHTTPLNSARSRYVGESESSETLLENARLWREKNCVTREKLTVEADSN